ncbi:Gfo/Idh/MocA family oxidoreductase [Pseudomonadales bacterium]|nr:Gfo/Idh/MocA family oxidoreductase [Pseudomonadales bacterium]
MKKNIAVVGCGHWGKNLVRNFWELGVLVAVCDPNRDLAQRYADEYSVMDLSFSDILNDSSIEGVVLAVPAVMHCSMALAAMGKGKSVFVEKPIAMNVAEAKLMISSANKNKVQLMVGHLLQYHPVFVALRKLTELGQLGNLQYLYSNRLSFGKIRSEEDVIWSFAPHDISMILSLVGQEVIAVKTESSAILQGGIADTATIHMEFDSGVKAHILVSWLHPCKEQKLVVIGDAGMAVFDDTKPWCEKLAVYRHKVDITESQAELSKSNVEYLVVEESEPLRNECKHFIEVISGRVRPLTDCDEGLSVLNVLSAASLPD